jgi:hypothetical protein
MLVNIFFALIFAIEFCNFLYIKLSVKFFLDSVIYLFHEVIYQEGSFINTPGKIFSEIFV